MTDEVYPTEFKISLSEFRLTLTGVDFLLSAGLKLQFGNTKRTPTEWAIALKDLGNQKA